MRKYIRCPKCRAAVRLTKPVQRVICPACHHRFIGNIFDFEVIFGNVKSLKRGSYRKSF